MESLREKVIKHITENYNSDPEYLWARYPNYAIFRHKSNKKWFAGVFDVSRKKLDLEGDSIVDILNVKMPDLFTVQYLTETKGFLKGYHMSGEKWISVLLDGTVPFENICAVIEESFKVTSSDKKAPKGATSDF